MLGLSAITAPLFAAIPLAVGQAFVFGSVGSVLADPTLAQGGDPAVLDSFIGQYGGTFASYAISFVVVTLLTGVLTRAARPPPSSAAR